MCDNARDRGSLTSLIDGDGALDFHYGLKSGSNFNEVDEKWLWVVGCRGDFEATMFREMPRRPASAGWLWLVVYSRWCDLHVQTSCSDWQMSH